MPQNKGGVYDSPLCNSLGLFLKVETNRKLQLSHGRSAFKTGDLSVVSALAINTGRSAIVCTECVHRVVEYVEGVYAELGVQLLRDLEFLYRRHVRVKT